MTSLERARTLVWIQEEGYPTDSPQRTFRVGVHAKGVEVGGRYLATEAKAKEEEESLCRVIADALDAAVAEALAVGGVPGVELTTEQVQEIAKRHAKTTPGEWLDSGIS